MFLIHKLHTPVGTMHTDNMPLELLYYAYIVTYASGSDAYRFYASSTGILCTPRYTRHSERSNQLNSLQKRQINHNLGTYASGYEAVR